MKRVYEIYLEKWIKKNKRKPLIIRGARQVGKSTLVRNFAKQNDLELFEINLENDTRLESLFKTCDTREVLNEVELIVGKRGVLKSKSLLFLDEIQAIPSAIPALRYFYEEYPELPVICAGSLLEFVLVDHSFSMPVGRVEYLFMGPMMFEEFLGAKYPLLLDYLSRYSFDKEFSSTAHEKLTACFRDYLLVGGMPEAVDAYADESVSDEVFDIHASIIQTYRDDFAKYAKGASLRNLQKVFDYAGTFPGQKIKYSNIDTDVQARDLKSAANLLKMSRVLFPVHHSNSSGIPISLGKSDKVYKLFFLDVGLVNRMCRIPRISLKELKKIEFLNKGTIAEQFIAQHLFYLSPHNESPELYYWLRDKQGSNAEVDFVLQVENRLVPIEVKAGEKGTLKSLHRFAYEKKSTLALRFNLSKPSIQCVKTRIKNSVDDTEIEYKLLSLPLYFVGQTQRLLKNSFPE